MFSVENRYRPVGLLLFFAFLALYTHTLQQHISTADNAEFQLVGIQLGLAHPPGFPLYTILSGLAARFPLSIASHIKINFLSALSSSLTLLLVYLTSFRLSKHIGLSLVAATALGTATTFWQQAVYANVRTFTALFAALCLWSLVQWRLSESEQKHRYVLIFALALGFGFTHHLSLAFIGLVMVLWLLSQDWRTWRWLPVGLLGLLPWLYLPILSPDLRELSAFLNYVLGLGFGGDFFSFITPADLWARAGVMRNVLTFQMNGWLLFSALLGWLACWRENRSIALLLGLSFAFHTFITATYRAPQTVEYMLPAYVPLAISIACLGVYLSKLNLPQASRLVQLGFAILIAVQFGAKLPSFRALAVDAEANDYAHQLLSSMPEGGQILSNWHWYNTLKLVQEVQQVREDIDVRYVVPAGESYASNWIDQISAGISAEIPTLATNSWPEFHNALPPGTSVGAATLWTSTSDITAQTSFTPANIWLGEQIRISAYKVEQPSLTIGAETSIQLVWSSAETLPPASLFIHLVGGNGQIYAQDDRAARPGGGDVTQTTFRLTPQWGAAPGQYQLLVGAYLADGTVLLDSAENPRRLLAQLTVEAAEWPPYTRHPLQHAVGDNQTLIGYDVACFPTLDMRSYHHFRNDEGNYYSLVFNGYVIPNGIPHGAPCDSYVPLGQGIFWLGSTPVTDIRPNQTLKLTQQFVSTQPLTSDLAVSVSLTGFEQDNVTWAWQDLDDSIPAMGRDPYLKMDSRV